MLLPPWLDPEYLIQAAGPYALPVVTFIIFAECGLFAILPGDSLLFTVGLFVARDAIPYSLPVVCLVLTLAAIAETLNADGVPTVQGGARWHASTIRAILRRSNQHLV